jgi:hypothetical protein
VPHIQDLRCGLYRAVAREGERHATCNAEFSALAFRFKDSAALSAGRKVEGSARPPRDFHMPLEVMIRRLKVDSALSDDDVAALQTLPNTVKDVAEGTVVVREGDSRSIASW